MFITIPFAQVEPGSVITFTSEGCAIAPQPYQYHGVIKSKTFDIESTCDTFTIHYCYDTRVAGSPINPCDECDPCENYTLKRVCKTINFSCPSVEVVINKIDDYNFSALVNTNLPFTYKWETSLNVVNQTKNVLTVSGDINTKYWIKYYITLDTGCEHKGTYSFCPPVNVKFVPKIVPYSTQDFTSTSGFIDITNKVNSHQYHISYSYGLTTLTNVTQVGNIIQQPPKLVSSRTLRIGAFFSFEQGDIVKGIGIAKAQGTNITPYFFNTPDVEIYTNTNGVTQSTVDQLNTLFTSFIQGVNISGANNVPIGTNFWKADFFAGLSNSTSFTPSAVSTCSGKVKKDNTVSFVTTSNHLPTLWYGVSYIVPPYIQIERNGIIIKLEPDCMFKNANGGDYKGNTHLFSNRCGDTPIGIALNDFFTGNPNTYVDFLTAELNYLGLVDVPKFIQPVTPNFYLSEDSCSDCDPCVRVVSNKQINICN